MTHTRKNRSAHNKTTKRIFTKTDYNSGDGMLTSVWGASAMAFFTYNEF